MVGRKLSTCALAGSLAAIAVIGGCRDEATTGPAKIPSKDYAANVRLQAGDFQTGPVALPLPQALVVTVTDAGGNPVAGASVHWTVTVGGGTVNPPTGTSDATGRVSTSWTLGTNLGDNAVKAYLTGAYILDSATFRATAINGQGAVIKIVESSKPPATAPVTTVLPALSYVITDQFGHPAPGSVVTFTTGGASGTVAPASAAADSTGKVSAVWTIGNLVGVQTFNATLAGQLPITSTLTATPDSSRRIAIFGGNNQSINVGTTAPTVLSVQVTDRFNNVIAGEPVAFNDSIGNGNSVQPTAVVTDVSGIATSALSVGQNAGLQKLRVRIAGSGGQVVRFSATTNVTFRDVYAGDYYVCGVTTSDRAYCWGFGEDGQLGVVSRIRRNSPSWPVTQLDTIAGPFPTFRDVSGGPSHTCGVSISRALFCWGYSPDGRMFVTPGSPFAIAPPGATSIRTVTTGSSFSCYITLGGLANCAGTNEVGESAANPGPVNGYSFIAAGQRHGCGMPRFDPLFPTASRTPLCWGANGNGQLGDGLATFLDQTAPITVSMPAGITFDSTSIVAGAAHTCALVSFNSPIVGQAGTAYCWGSNSFGQLGKNTTLFPGTRDSVPRPVSGGIAFARLYAGLYHTCGLTPAGAAFCWGRNTSGQLGTGNVTPSGTPVAVTGGLTFRNLALGELFTCGITGPGPGTQGTTGTAGVIFCWGDNEMGQLGTGAFGGNAQPVLSPVRAAFQQ